MLIVANGLKWIFIQKHADVILVNMNIEKHGIEKEKERINRIPLILSEKIVHLKWTMILKKILK